nr:SGNH/GDSL hydrolase family protein [Francisella halioticida]
MWGGANNVFQGYNMQDAAKDVIYDADYLVSKGASANNIYIANLPDLGITPLAISTKTVTPMNAQSKIFNSELNSLLKSKKYHLIDVVSFLNKIVKNKKITINGKTYLFSNVTDGLCKTGSPTDPNALICVPDLSKQGASTYLFEGNIHPTSYLHQVLAQYIKSNIDKTHT